MISKNAVDILLKENKTVTVENENDGVYIWFENGLCLIISHASDSENTKAALITENDVEILEEK